MKKINIAIDGPAGSGKGTLAKRIANYFTYLYIDTGIMYRIVTFLLLKKNINPEEKEKVVKVLEEEFEYDFRNDKVYLKNEEVTSLLRESDVNDAIRKVASTIYIREFLVDLQKRMANKKGVVMDGRDITSVVLKDAELKIYLDASLEVRSERRYKEYLLANKNTSYEEVKESISKRDYNDMHVSKALVLVKDAVYIDTSLMTIEEVFSSVVELVKRRCCDD